jgi:hypothetical protein
MKGSKKYIAELYERPALRFLKFGEPWAEVADLIFGPDELYLGKVLDESVRARNRARLESLKILWAELRDDILAAHEHYQPKKKPWGARFDLR